MRNQRELASLIVAAIIGVLILLGFIYFSLPTQKIGDVAPQPHTIEEDAPEEVQDPPPSAVGDIDKP